MTEEVIDRLPEDPDAVDDEPRHGPDTDEPDRRDPTEVDGSMSFPGEDGPDVVGSVPSSDEMGPTGEP